jgi:hypothetical protein
MGTHAMHRDEHTPKQPAGTDPQQAYHWSAEWQAGEREVDAEIADGRFVVYETIDDMFDELGREAS